MIDKLIRVFCVAFGLLSPVDEANVAVASSMGVHSFEAVVDDELVELDCEGLPIAGQHRACVERMRWALLTISNRESAGNWSPGREWTGIHQGDAKWAGRVRYWAGKFGRISWWCPFHWSRGGFSTVGPHGMMYGYNVQLLGIRGNCVPTRAFAVSSVSAEAAGRRYLKSCTKPWRDGIGWCPSVAQIVATKRRARRKGYESKTQMSGSGPGRPRIRNTNWKGCCASVLTARAPASTFPP